MPRQLPWLNKAAATRTQVKPAPKAAKRPRTDSDSGDDFFAGTVLETSRKERERADPCEPDDEFPEPLVPSTRKGKGRIDCSDRALSSSPPPAVSELPPPRIEFMKKGVDKFELRDDEWMMVEDEFLQTAKLFTRHLHLAEYERLKKNIETRKEISRPVVPDAKPSVQGQFQQKAKVQAKAQRNALNDVFTASGKNGTAAPTQASSKRLPSSSFSGSSRLDSAAPSKTTAYSSVSRLSSKESVPRRGLPGNKLLALDASDSDDLDALQRPLKPFQEKPNSTSTSFAKPTLPSKARPTTSRPTRVNLFDMLDDPSPKRSSSPVKSSETSTSKPSSSSTSKFSHSSKGRPTTAKPGQSSDFLDDFGFSKTDALPKEQTDRLARRKAEKEKDKEREKRKSVKLDDIPTFLF